MPVHILGEISGALAENPILTLFIVIGLGYLFGAINFFGFRFGIAGVLFMGIAVGALGSPIHIPEVVASLGLIIFVYTLGIQAGPGFFRSFAKQGARQTLLAVAVLTFGFLLTIPLSQYLKLGGARAAGLYAGALTSTPTLAAVRDRVHETGTAQALGPDQLRMLENEPVVGYGITYPFGVVGVLLLFQITRRWWKVKLKGKSEGPEIRVRDFTVLNPAAVGKSLAEVMRYHREPGFVISRIQHEGRTELPRDEMVLAQGDVVAVVGEEEGLQRAEMIFGAEAKDQIEMDRTELDFRRFLVSHKQVVGKKIRDLNLAERGGNITRIRRGDAELVPTPDTRLEYGDSVRVVTQRENFAAMSQFFGDSVRGSAETQFGSVAIGMVLGVLVGMFPIPLPNGQTLRLGLAGGPLLVALVLGRLEHTGQITWVMPTSANLTLRQIGSVLFLAGVGTNAGFTFIDTIRTSGIQLLVAGAVVTTAVHVIVMVVGYKVMKLPFDYLMGLASGIQTQAACVAYADDVSRSEAPSLAYASIYPVAMISKIILAQLLL